MSKTVRFKLSEEEYTIVRNASRGLGVSVDVLAKQALAYTLAQAQGLSEAVRKKEEEVEDGTNTTSIPET